MSECNPRRAIHILYVQLPANLLLWCTSDQWACAHLAAAGLSCCLLCRDLPHDLQDRVVAFQRHGSASDSLLKLCSLQLTSILAPGSRPSCCMLTG